MAFKELTGSNAISLGEQQPGWSLEGYYVGQELIPTKFGDRALHAFEDAEGKRHELWGSARLTRRLEGAEGCWVKVQYVGKTVDKKGNSAHEVKVFADEDRRRHVQQEIPV